MAKHHVLKMHERFADAVLDGSKPFEVRYDDRGYATGDTVSFVVVDGKGSPVAHDLCDRSYRIGYILSGWGLQDGYVAFGISSLDKLEEVEDDEE